MILQKGEELVAPCDLDCAEELISETIWDGPMENTRNEREKLAALLNVQIGPISYALTHDTHIIKSVARDENASYAALLREFSS